MQSSILSSDTNAGHKEAEAKTVRNFVLALLHVFLPLGFVGQRRQNTHQQWVNHTHEVLQQCRQWAKQDDAARKNHQSPSIDAQQQQPTRTGDSRQWRGIPPSARKKGWKLPAFAKEPKSSIFNCGWAIAWIVAAT